jgi:uncharacterized protein YndB with AHSA1/START domain
MKIKRTEVSVSRFILADAAKLFYYWLEPEKIKTWIFPSPGDTINTIKTDPRAGRAFNFTIRRGGETVEHVGKYLEIKRPEKLVFTWAVADEEGADRIELAFIPKGSGTEVALTTILHPDWAEYAEPTKKAWAAMLESLKKMAE